MITVEIIHHNLQKTHKKIAFYAQMGLGIPNNENISVVTLSAAKGL